jgi:hypothetical protein
MQDFTISAEDAAKNVIISDKATTQAIINSISLESRCGDRSLAVKFGQYSSKRAGAEAADYFKG